MTLRLDVLGSAGSWPAPDLPSSGFVVSDDDTRILMDLGFGTMTRLSDPLDIDAIVLSHRHPDHCVDVLALFHLWAYGPDRKVEVPLMAPQSTIDSLARFVAAKPDSPFWQVFVADPVEHGDRRQIGTMNLEFVTVDHPGPSVGTRIQSDSRSLFYTGDTGLEGRWWEAVESTHVLLSEASWQGNGDGGDYTHHLTAVQAGELATNIQAERLVLTHVKPGLDPVRSVVEAQTTFPGQVLHAAPGLMIEV